MENIFEKTQIKLLQLKTTTFERKTTVDGIHSRLSSAKEKVPDIAVENWNLVPLLSTYSRYSFYTVYLFSLKLDNNVVTQGFDFTPSLRETPKMVRESS